MRAVNERLDHVPGEVLVKFRAGTDAVTQSSIMGLAPAPADGRRTRWVGELAVVSTDSEAPAAAIAARLAREPEVEYAQPNHFVRLSSTPNDPGLSQQWNLDTVDVPRAWDINPGGADVLVAVIDSGITTVTANVGYRLWTGQRFENVAVAYRVNPDLDAARIATPIDTTFTRLIIQGPTPQPVFDTQGHGTHVAGTVLQSTNNALGFAGIAYAAAAAAGEVVLLLLGPPVLSLGHRPTRVRRSGVRRRVRDRRRRRRHPRRRRCRRQGHQPQPRRPRTVARATPRPSTTPSSAAPSSPWPSATSSKTATRRVPGRVRPPDPGRDVGRRGGPRRPAAPSIPIPARTWRSSRPVATRARAGPSGLIFQTGLFEPDFDSTDGHLPAIRSLYRVAQAGHLDGDAARGGAGGARLLAGHYQPGGHRSRDHTVRPRPRRRGTDPQYGAGLIDARSTLRGLGLAR